MLHIFLESYYKLALLCLGKRIFHNYFGSFSIDFNFFVPSKAKTKEQVKRPSSTLIKNNDFLNLLSLQ